MRNIQGCYGSHGVRPFPAPSIPQPPASLEGLDQATASNLVKPRPEAGYPSVQAFLDHPMLAGRDIKARGLAVGSQQFRATIDVELDGRRLRLVSDLRSIDGKTLRVEQRHLLPNPAKADRPNE